MNFFEAQDSARRSTSLLVLMFIAAIIALVAFSNLIVFAIMHQLQFGYPTLSFDHLALVFDINLCIMISAAIISFITLGSLYKLISLSSGGPAIAQQLGGVIVPRSSPDPLHKKILNVVEEMAIASGTPVPQVYVLPEQGINAFAAGWKTTNAVIGITQGALQQLNRYELQGVIAHEFSHIFNGDMRLNIRLIAILHGILMIGLMGHMIIRSLRFARSSRGRSDGRALLFLYGTGAGLMIIGYSGTFFGNWIKSLISRQREYLADASAVQFTRNPEGIGNALKKIGGSIPGSRLLAASAAEYSHAYFARGDGMIDTDRTRFFSFSTHPPLKERIKRIDPHWDGRYIFDENTTQVDGYTSGKQARDENSTRKKETVAVATGVGAGIALNDAVRVLDDLGHISQQQIDAAKLWHQQLPVEILEYVENPYGAQALILAMLIHQDEAVVNTQKKVLVEQITELHTSMVFRARSELDKIGTIQVFNLIDLSLPTLREMTVEQYQRFRTCIKKLVLADRKVELREWIIQRVILQHLDEQYGLRKKPVAKYFIIGSVKQPIEQLLSMLAYIEHPGDAEAQAAFNSAKKSVSAGALRFQPGKKINIKQLNQAMDELERLKYPVKKRFLEACVHCISYNGMVKLPSYELTRAIASCLDVPVPPVLTTAQE